MIPRSSARPARRVAGLSGALCVALLATGLAFHAGSGVAAAQQSRTGCDDPPEEFLVLCQSYELIQSSYVDSVSPERLARAAARGVRDANLPARDAFEAPSPCALPAPAFEQVCVEIDRAADTGFAVWAAAQAMVNSLGDPFQSLIPAAQYDGSPFDAAADYFGVGILIGLLDRGGPCEAVSQTCKLVVSEVFADSPAEHVGIKADDVIIALNDPIPEGWSCATSTGFGLQEGIKARLQVQRGDEVLNFRAAPATVNAASVGWRIVDGIGYLRLDRFGESAQELFDAAIGELLKRDPTALIIDLRGNSGGYLDSVLAIASHFLDEGQTIARTVSTRESVDLVVEDGGDVPRSMEVRVLVDGQSASASELLVLALRDHGRAQIVGTPTFGKNSAQVTHYLTTDSNDFIGAFRVTTDRWEGPRHSSSAGGIAPDVLVALTPCAHAVATVRQTASASGLSDVEFTDLAQAEEHLEAVQALMADGIWEGLGCQLGRLCPNDPITRAELAVALVRAIDGDDPTSATGAFSDVDPEDWWAPHVERLAELGITNGCGDGAFCPYLAVTAKHMTAFLQRAFGSTEVVDSEAAITRAEFSSLLDRHR